MKRISRMIAAAGLAASFSVAVPATAYSATPVYEATSSGLITFSDQDSAIRVAITFAEKDDAVVPTLVRFIDSRGRILKQQRGDVRHGESVVAELTRRDLVVSGSLLVRVEVVHKLPGIREKQYPILVSVQPLAIAGFARFSRDWHSGGCGNPLAGSSTGSGQHVDCEPPPPVELES